MEIFIRKPSVDLFPGIRVDKETMLEYENENVWQQVAGLVMHTVMKVRGENFQSVYDTTIYLQEGDVLIFEDGGRGYIKPAEPVATIAEVAAELQNIKDLG